MKRYLNYILLLSNLIVSIIVAILLVLFSNEFKHAGGASDVSIYNRLLYSISFPVISTVFSIFFMILYFYLFRKELKNGTEKINPRLLSHLKYTALFSIINFVFPVALMYIAILNINPDQTILLLGIAFGVSGFITIVISGFTSYFNLRINYAQAQREVLKQESLNDAAKANDSKDDNIPKRDASSKDDHGSSKVTAPTSGSF